MKASAWSMLARHTGHCGRWGSLHPWRRSGRWPEKPASMDRQALCKACRLYRALPFLPISRRLRAWRDRRARCSGRCIGLAGYLQRPHKAHTLATVGSKRRWPEDRHPAHRYAGVRSRQQPLMEHWQCRRWGPAEDDGMGHTTGAPALATQRQCGQRSRKQSGRCTVASHGAVRHCHTGWAATMQKMDHCDRAAQH